MINVNLFLTIDHISETLNIVFKRGRNINS